MILIKANNDILDDLFVGVAYYISHFTKCWVLLLKLQRCACLVKAHAAFMSCILTLSYAEYIFKVHVRTRKLFFSCKAAISLENHPCPWMWIDTQMYLLYLVSQQTVVIATINYNVYRRLSIIVIKHIKMIIYIIPPPNRMRNAPKFVYVIVEIL